MNKTIAVILAGGKGERFANDLPKQFVKLAGKSVIEYTLNAFNKHKEIDEIYVVVKEGFEDKIWAFAKKNNFRKIVKVINGGEDRFGSTNIAINAMKDEDPETKVLFHDGVRPLVDEVTIQDVVKALNHYDAVDTAIDATDTIIKIDDDWIIDEIPDRAYMKRGLTPQGFRLKTLQRAYEKAIAENRRKFTCDCGVVQEMLHVDIKVVKSNPMNIKITYPIDLHMAEKYIQMGSEYTLSDIELKNLDHKNIVIFGNSSGIGRDIEEIAKDYGANVYGGSRKSGVDVSNRNDIKTFIDKVEHIDIVINTASILIKKPLELMSQEEISEIVNINYMGTVNVAYAVKSHLEKSRGVLINFASSSYTRGRANYALYSSSKAAIVNFTQALSDEWENVRVNCVNPERTKTPMREKNFGYESPETLLDSKSVAIKTLKLALSPLSGTILDIKK